MVVILVFLFPTCSPPIHVRVEVYLETSWINKVRKNLKWLRMAKQLVQLILAGAQVVGRAFTQAVRQEIRMSQEAAKRNATAGSKYNYTWRRICQRIFDEYSTKNFFFIQDFFKYKIFESQPTRIKI